MVLDERLCPIRWARRTMVGEMGFQVREVQRRHARVAGAVLDGRYDRTPRLRHILRIVCDSSRQVAAAR